MTSTAHLSDDQAKVIVDAAIAANRSGPGVLLGTVEQVLANHLSAQTAPQHVNPGTEEADEPEGRQTWTFFGHFDDSGELIVDHAVEGAHEDVYSDDGRYEGGLWCDTGTGATLEAAEANARALYTDDGTDPDILDCVTCRENGLAYDPERHDSQNCWVGRP